jgi:hypothetical protein
VVHKQIFGEILCELLGVNLSLLKQQSPFVDQSQITASILIQKVQLIFAKGFFFDIDQPELLRQLHCLYDLFASATTAQIKDKIHLFNLYCK